MVEEAHQSSPIDVVEDLCWDAAQDEDIDDEETAPQEVNIEHSAVGDAVAEEDEKGWFGVDARFPHSWWFKNFVLLVVICSVELYMGMVVLQECYCGLEELC